MNWTEEQAKAIELRNKSILVSAAAGSGKTAVLVERIKRLIIEEHCPIDRMLIVTFTNAAASEMKEKIEKAIRKAIEESKEEKEIKELKRQLDLLPRGNISTFHAFAMEVIHRYFHIINVEPNFKICDESQKILLKSSAMDQLLENLYEEASPRFHQFLNRHSGDRNDDSFRWQVERTYETIQSLPEPYLWLENAVEKLKGSDETFKASDLVQFIWEETESILKDGIEAIESIYEWAEKNNLEELKKVPAMDRVTLEPLLLVAQKREFDGMKAALEGFKFATMKASFSKEDKNPDALIDMQSAKEHIRETRDAVKKNIANVKEKFFSQDFHTHCEEMRETYEDGVFLMEAVRAFQDLFREGKEINNMVDFNDIEHFAYEILKNQEAAQYYREKFNYIFIDEYQDSNVLQEELIGKIKREDNLFMVGDVKQSIYKFRLAEPEIFQKKYKEFADDMKLKGGNSLTAKIDLNKNFRSKREIIDFINDVFKPLMNGYDDDAALYPGDPHSQEHNFKPKLYLNPIFWDAEEDLDEPLKNLQKTEKEALAAVKIIKDYLGKPIFDSKTQTVRPLEKRDVVILLRGVRTYGDMFYRILTENHLPAFVDDNDGYFDTIEINTFMAFLMVLDNEKQDIPLLTVLRSEILEYSINELVEIRLFHKDDSYYDALKIYSLEGKNESLKEKCRQTFHSFKKWREMSRLLPLEELIWELLLDTGFYLAVGAMPSGIQRQANLRAFVDKALEYSRKDEVSLYGFVKYIQAVQAGKVSMGQMRLLGENDDTIRIMTIHKSKGLEFPMVLIGGFCNRLNYSKTGRSIAIHKDLGIGLPLVNYEKSWYKTTLMQKAIAQKMKREEIEEEKRILYVAMTRAKDILVMLGSLKDVEVDRDNIKMNLPKESSYFTMTGRTICNMGGNGIEIPNSELQGLSRYTKRSGEKGRRFLDEGEITTSPDVERRLRFTYPYAKETIIKSKYSVSELNVMEAGKDFSKNQDKLREIPSLNLTQPESFKRQENFTPREIGVITHKVLEKMDFIKIGEELETGGEKSGVNYIETLLQSMVSEEFITETEKAVVNKKALVRFAKSSLGRRIGKAQGSGTLRREQLFNLKMKVDGEEAIVQGAIDCYFQEAGELVVVDYKTTSIRNMDEFERRKSQIKDTYKKQIEIYSRALEAAYGKKVKEAYLYMTNIDKVIEM